MTHHEEAGPITVLRTNDPALLAVAKSLLEEADIEFFVAGEALLNLFPGGAIGSDVTPEIQVAADKADEARELLSQLGDK